MMPTYHELIDLRVSDLDSAVEDWRSTYQGLDDLAEQARDGMKAKAESANWRGENAGVTRGYVVAVAGDFQLAFEEARGIHGVLSDLRDALRSCKQRLETLRDEARETGLEIGSDGKVTAPPQDPNQPSPSLQDPLLAGLPDENLRPPERLAEIEDLEAQIAAILAEAAEYDTAAKQALNDLAGPDGTGFVDGAWRDLDEAREWYGEQDAQLALALMTGGPADITDRDLERLNELLTEHAHNEAFATYLATGLGARGTLEFWDQMLNPGHQFAAGEDRTQLLTDLQSNLGATLGLATRSGDPAMQDWERNMIELGDERFGDEYGDPNWQPYGYQLMSSLMGTEAGDATGKFGKDFLTDYGNALLEFEQGMDPPGSEWETAYTGTSPTGMGSDAFRLDPMTGYMEALSHNPAAATQIFSMGENAETMQYLLVDRQGEHGILQGETSESYTTASLDATGNALLAATTGLNPHDLSAEPVGEDWKHDQLRNDALSILAETEDDFPEELRNPVSAMLVNHGSDFVDTMTLPLDERPMDKGDLYDVVTQISRGEESYALLNEGMNYHLTDYITNPQNNPGDTLIGTGETIGFLEAARVDALEAGAEEASESAGEGANWTSAALGSAVGFIPGGGGIYAAGAAIGVDMVIEGWLQDEQRIIEEELEADTENLAERRDAQLGAFTDLWWRQNAEWGESAPGYQTEIQVLDNLKDSVNNGKNL
ncbi:hypothetical protein [Streptomyces sp. 6N223]|uniref:hypothetical protein n=1 Tax=Streptomyces sp. 6N223 TaxID=3457412 RepID=UPI003FCF5988